MRLTKLLAVVSPPFFVQLARELADCRTVLDLGCGRNSPLRFLQFDYSVGVDICLPYLAESKSKRIHDEYVHADITRIEFQEKSFDAVVLLSVLEHLPKSSAERLLKDVEKWSGRKIVLYTPNGFVARGEIDKNPYQKHISEWFVADFVSKGYEVRGAGGAKKLAEIREHIEVKGRLVWELIFNLTQKMLVNRPEHSVDLFCVKDLQGDNKSSSGDMPSS